MLGDVYIVSGVVHKNCPPASSPSEAIMAAIEKKDTQPFGLQSQSDEQALDIKPPQASVELEGADAACCWSPRAVANTVHIKGSAVSPLYARKSRNCGHARRVANVVKFSKAESELSRSKKGKAVEIDNADRLEYSPRYGVSQTLGGSTKSVPDITQIRIDPSAVNNAGSANPTHQRIKLGQQTTSKMMSMHKKNEPHICSGSSRRVSIPKLKEHSEGYAVQAAQAQKLCEVSNDAVEHTQMNRGREHSENAVTSLEGICTADSRNATHGSTITQSIKKRQDANRRTNEQDKSSELCSHPLDVCDMPGIPPSNRRSLPCLSNTAEAPSSLMKICIRTCTVGQDSVIDTDADKEESCSCHRDCRTLSLNIEAKEVNSKRQCHMLLDTANGVETPSCESWGGEWTAQWVSEQQELLAEYAGSTSNSGKCTVQCAVDAQSSGKGASGEPDKDGGQPTVEEEWKFKDFKEGTGEGECRVPEHIRNESLKEEVGYSGADGCTEPRGKGNESCSSHVGASDLAGFVFQRPLQEAWKQGKCSRGWWLPKVACLGKSTKEAFQEAVLGRMSVKEMGESSTEQIFLSSCELPSREVVRNMNGLQKGWFDVSIQSKEAIQPSDGIFWIDSVNMPNVLPNSGVPGTSWTLSLSQGAQVRNSGCEAQIAPASYASTSLWSDFSQRTQVQEPFWCFGDASNSRQGSAGQRNLQSVDALSSFWSSTGSLNHPRIKIVDIGPNCSKSNPNQSVELAHDINQWMQNGLDAAGVSGSNQPPASWGHWGSHVGRRTALLSCLHRTSLFGCGAPNRSRLFQSLTPRISKQVFMLSEQHCHIAPSAAHMEPTSFEKARGVPYQEYIRKLAGLWKLDRQKSDNMDGFCEVMELKWMQRKAAKTIRHLKVRVNAKGFRWFCKMLLVYEFGMCLPLSGIPVERRRPDGRMGSVRAWMEARPEGIIVMSAWGEPVGGTCEDTFQLSADEQVLVRTATIVRDTGQRCVVRWVLSRINKPWKSW